MVIYRFKEAEQDCTNALVLHAKNLKAAWRRGVARRGLGRLDDARQGILYTEKNKKPILGYKAIDNLLILLLFSLFCMDDIICFLRL